MTTNHSPLATKHSPGLSRALHATAPPRRGIALDGYERAGARRERERLSRAALAVALGLLVVALFFLWERSKASGYTFSHWGWLGPSAGDDYDQGAYVVSAQLLSRGYALFNPVFSAQPAFFLPSLAAVLRVVGDPIVGGHIYEALFGVATLAGVFWMAWTAYRPLAAPLAAALLAVSPGFLLYAHAVEAEVPMLGLGTLAVAAAQAYYVSHRRVMAALAGLLLMAATEMKLLSVVFVPPMAMLLLAAFWQGHRAGRPLRAIVTDALAFLLALVVPALVVLALFFPAEQWRQVVIFHLHAGTGALDAAANVHALRVYLGYDLGLLVAAAAGTLLGLLQPRTRYLTLVYALWFLATLIFLWRYHPLFQHQFVPLVPPLALMGAALAGPVWRRPVIGRLRDHGAATGEHAAPVAPRGVVQRVLRPAPLAIGALGIVYLAILFTHTLPIDGHLFARPVTPHRDALVALLDRTTKPGDFVACDDPMVALLAHRFMPPGMEDPSRVRTTAGYLTAAEAIAATQRYHVAAIVASRPMFAVYLQPYLAWARANYRATASGVPGAEVYLRR